MVCICWYGVYVGMVCICWYGVYMLVWCVYVGMVHYANSFLQIIYGTSFRGRGKFKYVGTITFR